MGCSTILASGMFSGGPIVLQLDLALAKEHILHGWLIALHERPAFDSLSAACILRLRVLKYLPLLLLSAIERLILAFKLLAGVAWGRHGNAPRQNLIPVDVLEERVTLDFVGASSTGTKALTRVAVKQVDNQVLSLLRHADGQLEYAALDIVK